MEWVKVKINKEGFKGLSAWAKTKLTEEDQDKLATILDDIFEFEGLLGQGIELVDNKLFKVVIKTGKDEFFPDEQEVNPS
jgi:Asp-tRNA(Asn)/Glu-tRNA(Gln) amidotransferase C subunit